MPRAFGSVSTTAAVSTGTAAKTILQYTAPAAGAVIKVAGISFDGVSSATAKVPVDLIRGATGGTGSAVTPAARGSNNPTGPTLGTAKENFTVEPSGGTVIQQGFAQPYGAYPFELPQEIVLAGGETLAIRTTASAAVNARGELQFDRVLNVARALSANLRSAINAQETGEAVLYLLKLEHASIGAPILVCNDSLNVTSRGNVYQAFPFEITLPEESDAAAPRVTLRICNVDRQIVEAVRTLSGEMEVTLELILASSPETVEAGPYVFTLKRAEYNVLVVEGELAYEDILNEPYPGDQFNQPEFPGLA